MQRHKADVTMFVCLSHITSSCYMYRYDQTEFGTVSTTSTIPGSMSDAEPYAGAAWLVP
jgi:hypothetical protein